MDTAITPLILGLLFLFQHGIPQQDLTVREIVETLADYDVKHVAQQPFFAPAYGVTDFSSNPPAIWIFSTGDTKTRIMTVIHELLHVRYQQWGVVIPEEFINSEEQRQYKKLFTDEK